MLHRLNDVELAACYVLALSHDDASSASRRCSSSDRGLGGAPARRQRSDIRMRVAASKAEPGHPHPCSDATATSDGGLDRASPLRLPTIGREVRQQGFRTARQSVSIPSSRSDCLIGQVTTASPLSFQRGRSSSFFCSAVAPGCIAFPVPTWVRSGSYQRKRQFCNASQQTGADKRSAARSRMGPNCRR